MSFRVLTRRAGDSALTLGTLRTTIDLCDPDIAAALNANPTNVFIAVLNDAVTNTIDRYLVIRDWPPGIRVGTP